eukprot:scaffold9353_cov136-Isochrysis_galbana.AAC.3
MLRRRARSAAQTRGPEQLRGAGAGSGGRRAGAGRGAHGDAWMAHAPPDRLTSCIFAARPRSPLHAVRCLHP